MKFVKEIYTKTLEVKQSKFIAYIMPYSLYDKTLQELKDSNPKARHFVVAFRYLNEYNQIVEYSSDDGEPRGTSGKPSLMVLQGAELIDSAVIIVRYFGGTKLGTGGLVRAYSDSVNLVLESSNTFEYKNIVDKNIYLDYAHIRLIEYECSQYNIDIVEKNFDTKITYKLQASETNMSNFLAKVGRIINLEQHFQDPTLVKRSQEQVE